MILHFNIVGYLPVYRFTLTLYFHLYINHNLVFILKVDPNHYNLQYSYNNVCWEMS